MSETESKKYISNAKLESIVAKAAEDLRQLVAEGEDKLLEAWNAAEQEAQENDTKPVFRIGFTIALDLDKDGMESALTFGVRHKLTINSGIPDPNQMEFPNGDGTVTLKSGDESVTVPVAKFGKLAKKLRKAVAP